MVNSYKQCWVIAGATSAIANSIAHEVAKQGHQVILLGRDPDRLSALQEDLRIRYQAQAEYLLFDALQTNEHAAIVKACVQRAKGPIYLCAAVGYMRSESALSQSLHDSVMTAQANFTGVVSVTLAFVPHIRAQKQGAIIILGSVAGDRGRASNFVYGAAKAGLVTFCEGLRAALHADHVSVTLMKLGFIDTPLTYGIPGSWMAASTQACAKACLRAVQKHKAVVYFPFFWWWIMRIICWIPKFIFSRLRI